MQTAFMGIRGLQSVMKKAFRNANTARAGCSKVWTPPARHKHTDRTDYNTLRRYLARSVNVNIVRLKVNFLANLLKKMKNSVMKFLIIEN